LRPPAFSESDFWTNSQLPKIPFFGPNLAEGG
jgi:hypothetical protein